MSIIPEHLVRFSWYAGHLSWLREDGIEPAHDPGDTAASRADLRGADLRGANLGGSDLRGADMRGANLRGADLGGSDLRGADMRGANLRGADLSGANLRGADMRGADLIEADLSGANLRGAVLFFDVPVVPKIDQRILEAITAPGCALDMGDWHKCETTHCRAGWAIHLAGKAGYALARHFGPSVAGALIYAASRPDQPVPDFYASNEETLEDLRRHATEGMP